MQVVWIGKGLLSKLCKDRERPQFVQLGSGSVKASIKWSFMQTRLLFTCYETGETIVAAVITSCANAIKSASRKVGLTCCLVACNGHASCSKQSLS